MREFWNQRYSAPQYAYGEAPNRFFQAQLDALPQPGNILLPAEGEGRNGVYAARKGWQVSAFDISEAGKGKADALATKYGVEHDYQVGSLETLAFEPNSFDVIALIFAHFPSDKKSTYHQHLQSLLKPGGTLIFEAFSKQQLTYNSQNPKAGGPKNLDMLFSIEDLQQDFTEIEFHLLEEVEVELQEGLYHQGKGSVVRAVGKKH